MRRTLHVSLALALLFMAYTTPSAGGEEPIPTTELRLQIQGEVGKGTLVAIPLKGTKSREELRRPLSSGDRDVALALAAGSWKLKLESPDTWSEVIEVYLGSEPRDATIAVRPAGQIAGQIELARGETPPERLRAEFNLLDSKVAEESPYSADGSSDCELRGKAFRCTVPAGHVDIGLKSQGFVPRWFWTKRVKRGQVAELGTVKLLRGASVTGWIEIGDGEGDPRDALLSLTQDKLLGPRDSDQARRQAIRGIETRANSRGHFSFEGIEPGSYSLEISLEGYTEIRRVGIPVARGSESFLPKPFQLFSARDLRLVIDPPLDPLGEPWSIELRDLEDPDSKPVGLPRVEGESVLRDFRPGRYSVLAKDSTGTVRTWSEELIVPSQDEVFLQIETFPVKGRVYFGEDLIPAKLTFGGQRSVASVEVTSDEDGEFQVDLPFGGNWKVEVDSPEVQGTHWIRLGKEAPRGGYVSAEIALPKNEVGGRTTDGFGNPVAGARLALFSQGQFRFEISDSAGRFLFRSVPAGEVVVRGYSSGGLSSMEQSLQVDDSGEHLVGDLVLRNSEQAVGIVESIAGGIQDALVLLLPRGAAALQVMPEQTTSGQDGFFETPLPQHGGALLAAVLAPGFPLQVLEMQVQPGIPFVLSIEDKAGDLVVRPGLTSSSIAPGSFLVFHEAFPLDASLLSMWARRNGSHPNAEVFRIPRVAPGEYTVCSDMDPSSLLQALRSGKPDSGTCVTVSVYDGDSTVVDFSTLDD